MNTSEKGMQSYKIGDVVDMWSSTFRIIDYGADGGYKLESMHGLPLLADYQPHNFRPHKNTSILKIINAL